jgi:DNA-binding NarL/FixJ family response regulator
MAIRVVIADDHPLVCAGLGMLLDAQPDIEVVGTASSGDQVVETVRELAPDVVLMDVQMPGLDGIEALTAITRDGQSADVVKVLMLTSFANDDTVHRSLQAGASGYLLKQAAPADLVSAVRRVSAGDAWIDPGVAGAVIAALGTVTRPGERPSELVSRLTPREGEILALVAQGLSNAEISEALVLSEATVKTHVSRVLIKTGSRDRAAAVALAYQSGLVVVSRPRT